MDLVNRLCIGKEKTKAKRESKVYLRFWGTTSSDDFESYLDGEIVSEKEKEEDLNEDSKDNSEEEEERAQKILDQYYKEDTKTFW